MKSSILGLVLLISFIANAEDTMCQKLVKLSQASCYETITQLVKSKTLKCYEPETKIKCFKATDDCEQLAKDIVKFYVKECREELK